MTKEQIEKKIEELKKDQANIEVNFHRVSGAIALLIGLLKEEQDAIVTEK